VLRPGIITFEMLVDDLDSVKKRVLLYDELWVPGIGQILQGGNPGNHYDDETFAGIAWLAEQGFVKEPPLKLAPDQLKADEVVKSLNEIYRDAEKSLDKTYRTPKVAALNAGAAVFNMDLSLTRLIAYVIWRDRRETAFPVNFPFVEKLAPGSAISKSQQVLAVVLKRFPDPRPDLPLEDVVAFKRDPETQYKFAKLWHWMQKVATNSGGPRELEEELDWLLTDYGHHVQQMSQQVRTDKLKTWITVPAEMLENIIKLKFGKIASRLLDLRSARIAAHDEELKAPGNEIAYIKESIELLSPKR
jgi:hypothetical protein